MVHLSLRAMGRYHTTNDIRLRGRHLGWGGRAQLVTSIANDVFQARQLARCSDLLLGRRFAVDLIDVAMWSVRCQERASSPTLGALPLIIEATIRRGWPSAVICAAHAGASGSARRVAGRQVRYVDQSMTWLGIVGALAVRYWERERVERLLSGVRNTVAAERELAALAGAATVMRSPVEIPGEDVGFPHDVIGNIRPFISATATEDSSILDAFLGNRKLAITEELRAAAGPRYVASVLSEWKTKANRELPRVADQITIELPIGGDGLVLLTPEQADALQRSLDEMRPRGTTRVSVVVSGPVGTRVALDVDGDRVELPPDRDLPLLDWADPSPAAAGLGFLFAILGATQVIGRLRLRSIAPGASAFLALSIVSARESRRRGDRSHYDMLRLSVAAAAVQAIGVLPETRRQPLGPMGQARLPGVDAIAYPAVMLGFCWSSTTPRQRRAVVLALSLVGLAAQLALPRPRRWRAAAFAFVFTSVTGLLASATYRSMTERDTRRAHRVLNTQVREELSALQAAGRNREWRLVLQACDEALEHLDVSDTDLAALVERRLVATRSAAMDALTVRSS